MPDPHPPRSHLYTRTGDDGSTGLFGGERVGKDHPRVAAYGDVDELNATLGLAAAEAQRLIAGAESGGTKPGLTSGPPVARKTGPPGAPNALDAVQSILARLQSRLFDLGADLATPDASRHEAKINRIAEHDVREAEGWIDEIDAGNTPMRHFVLPGGTELAARLHLARTIARRAERAMIHLSRSETVNPQAIIYINRISDLLFALARRANVSVGVADVPWMPARQGEAADGADERG